MQISARHEYVADPDSVIKMMADEKWLAEVARRAGAARWEVSSSNGDSHVRAEIPAPERVRRFTGPHLRFHLVISWQPPRADASRSGTISVDIKDMPASMGGTGDMRAALVAGRPGTEVDFEAQFSIHIPIIGRGLEGSAEPYVRRVIDTQQEVGNDYLAGRLG